MVSKDQLENGAPCKMRFLIYEQFVDQVLDTGLTLIQDYPHAAQGLGDVTIYQKLVRQLDRVAMCGVSRDMGELRRFLFRENSKRGQVC